MASRVKMAMLAFVFDHSTYADVRYRVIQLTAWHNKGGDSALAPYGRSPSIG